MTLLDGVDEISIDGVRYISAAQAARDIGLVRDYIARLCREGKVHGRRVGKNWYVEKSSFQSFIITHEYERSLRKESLKEERTREYKAEELRHGIATVVAAQPARSSSIAARFTTAPGFADAAIGTAYVPTYLVTPAMELLHKALALTLTLVLVCGSLALVDPGFAAFAASSVQGTGQSISAGYTFITNANQNAFVTSGRTQVAGAASAIQFDDPITDMALFWTGLAVALKSVIHEVAAALVPHHGLAAIPKPRPHPPKNYTPSAMAASAGTAITSIAETPLSSADTNGAPIAPQQPRSRGPPVGDSITVSSDPPALVLAASTSAFVTEGQFNAGISALSDSLRQLFLQTSAPGSLPASGGYTNSIALTNRIDNLENTSISSPTVSGGSISGASISATDLSASGNASIAGNLTVVGSLSGGSLSLSVASTSGIIATNATITAATTTSLFSGLANLTTGIVNVLTASIANITGLTATNSTTTNATTTNLYAASAVIPGLSGTSATFTNSTSTAFFATTASSTNLLAQTASLGTLNLNATPNALLSTNSSGQVVATSSFSSSLLVVPSNSLLAGNSAGAIIASTTIGWNLLKGPASAIFAFDNNGNPTATTTIGTNYLIAPPNSILAGNSSGTIIASTTIGTNLLSANTISGVVLGGNLFNLSATDQTLTFSGSYNGSVVRTVGLNLGNANSWTALQQFTTGASSSQESVFAKAYFGGTATTTIDSGGNVAVAGTLNVTGNTTITNATTTNLFSTIASSTNLFSQIATLGTLNASSLSLTSALPVQSGGTGATSLNSYPIVGNGTGALIASSTLWLAGINATSTTATSTIGTGGFTVGSSQLVVQQGSGNVGVGTTSPVAQFAVNGSAYIGSVLTLGSNGTASNPPIYAGGSQNTGVFFNPGLAAVSLTGGGAEQLRVRSSGVYANQFVPLSGNVFTFANSGNGSRVFSIDVQADGSTRLNSHNENNVGQNLVLDNNGGNVLVGTTTGTVSSLIVGTSTGPQLALSDLSSGNNLWTLRAISGSFYLATSTATATSTTAALAINSNGGITFANNSTTTGIGYTDTLNTGSLNGVLVVDGTKYATLAAAVSACPSNNCSIYVPSGMTIATTTIDQKSIKITFGRGTYNVTGTITISNTGGVIFEGSGNPDSGPSVGTTFAWKGGSSVPMFNLTDVSNSIFRNFFINSSPSNPLDVAFYSPDVAPISGSLLSTHDNFDNIIMNGTGSGGLNYGFRFGYSATNANNSNNDFMSFSHVHVSNYSVAAWSIENSQAKAWTFYDCQWQGNSIGQYGVTTALNNSNGGSFSWYGGGSGYNTVADFYLGSTDDEIFISGVNSEGSARLLETTGGTSGAWPVTIEGVRWSGNNLNSDGKVIKYTDGGPLTVRNSIFENTGATTALQIALTNSSAYGIAEGNNIQTSLANPLTGSGKWVSIGNTIATMSGATPSFISHSFFGSFGIGTSTPYASLAVWGANTSAGVAALTVANSASTTIFNVDNAGNATIGGSLSIGSLTGFLKATAGAITTSLINLASDVTGILPVANGGTGWANIAAGAIPYGNGSGALSTTTAGTGGQVLALLNGVPTWTATTTFSGGLAYSNGNVTLNTGNGNSWTGLQQFSNASSSLFSAYGPAYFGATATSSFTSAGLLGVLKTNPSYAVDVNGFVNVDGTAGGYKQAGNTILSASSTNHTLLLGNGAGIGLTSAANYGIAIGESALGNATSSLYDIAIGYQAGQNILWDGNSAFDHNSSIAIGYQALTGSASTLSTADNNIAIGSVALTNNISGTGNIAIGTFALQNATSTIRNVAIGSGALTGNSSNFKGNDNIGIGQNALHSVTTGSGNIAIAALGPLQSLTTGTGNVAIGLDQPLNQNTTGSHNVAIGDANGGSLLFYNTTGSDNVAIDSSLGNDSSYSSSGDNIAIGILALANVTSGGQNIAIGRGTLTSLTTGTNNVAISSASNSSSGALGLLTTGSNNVAFGQLALGNNTTGGNNTAIGQQAAEKNQSATTTVAVGYQSGRGAGGFYNNQGGTYIGYQSGVNVQTGSDYNTLLGYEAGNLVTTGAGNILIGAASTTANDNLTTGYGNIKIGDNISFPSATGNNQLDIGNLIYGTGLSGTGSTVSTGNIGIGTTSPSTKLQIDGSITPNIDNTYTDGNSTYRWSAVYAANGTIQTSDQRLKSNVTDLNYGLPDLLKLRPISFTWTAQPQQGTQLGFLAQDVQPVFPEIVNVGDDSNHTLGLTYTEFIPVIVKSIQQIVSISDDFRNGLIAWLGNTSNGIGDLFAANIHAQNELCVGSTCVNQQQLTAMLAAAGETSAPPPVSASNGSPASTTPSNEPPLISINGNNPATIEAGGTYNDLGATITGPQADLNLDIVTFVNGKQISPVQIDTTQAATDTIDYVVTDQNGLAATSTRTVIIEPAVAPSIMPSNGDSASITPQDAATSTGQ
jgi:hypothetical protein